MVVGMEEWISIILESDLLHSEKPEATEFWAAVDRLNKSNQEVEEKKVPVAKGLKNGGLGDSFQKICPVFCSKIMLLTLKNDPFRLFHEPGTTVQDLEYFSKFLWSKKRTSMKNLLDFIYLSSLMDWKTTTHIYENTMALEIFFAVRLEKWPSMRICIPPSLSAPVNRIFMFSVWVTGPWGTVCTEGPLGNSRYSAGLICRRFWVFLAGKNLIIDLLDTQWVYKINQNTNLINKIMIIKNIK